MEREDPSIVIAVATARDLDAIAPLFDAYRVFYRQSSDPRAARDFVAARLAEVDGSKLFVARIGDRAIGFARIWRGHSSIAVRPAWILEDLFVVAGERRHGVAAALMAAAEQHARDDGAVAISLETAVDNAAAQSLYDARGYLRETAFFKYNLALKV